MDIGALVIGVGIGGIAVGVIVYFWRESKRSTDVARLQGQLERAQDAEQLIQTAEQRMGTAFQAAAAPVMKQSVEQFLTSANDNFVQSRKSFEDIVKPLSENYAKLNPNIESLMRQNVTITETTQGLRDALTDNRQIGSWGEFQLARILELTGMTPYVDYSEQETVQGSGERPDVIVHLPDERDVVIDSKASLIAYLEATDNSDDESRDAALARHARALRTQVDDLAKKDYGDKVRGSLGFVVMFVPGDQFLSAALEANSSLVDYAMNKKVAIATPSTLFALLTALANGWQQHHLAQNAEEIRKAGVEMHNRLQTFMGHYKRAGDQLRRATESFNSSVGSFDRNVIPQARRFEELPGVTPNQDALPGHIDVEVRESVYGIAEPVEGMEDRDEPA